MAQATGTAWGWDIDGAAGYTNVRTISRTAATSMPNLFPALNDPVNPYLLTGGNSRSAEFVQPDRERTTIWNSLSFVQASGSRDLMQLEGGPLTLAIGAGDVYRNLNARTPGRARMDGRISARPRLRGRQPEQRQSSMWSWRRRC